MNEEVKRILKMVEEGKIDSSKAAELIEALQVQKVEVNPVNYEDRMLKIRIIDKDENEKDEHVNINVPVKFIKSVLKSVGKINLGESCGVEKVDPEMIAAAIDGNLTGKIVDIQSSDGEVVEISIE